MNEYIPVKIYFQKLMILLCKNICSQDKKKENLKSYIYLDENKIVLHKNLYYICVRGNIYV